MHKRKIDLVLLVIVIVISLFGLLMVYSASNVVALYEYNDSLYYFKRQLFFWLIGILLMRSEED